MGRPIDTWEKNKQKIIRRVRNHYEYEKDTGEKETKTRCDD